MVPRKTERIGDDVVRRRPSLAQPSRLSLFRARHPYGYDALRNLAVSGSLVAAGALITRGKFRKARTGMDEARGFYRNERAFRNQVSVEGAADAGLYEHVFKKPNVALEKARAARQSAHRWRLGTAVGGTALVTGSLVGPYERYSWQKKFHERRAPQRTLVVSKKPLGERRVIWT